VQTTSAKPSEQFSPFSAFSYPTPSQPIFSCAINRAVLDIIMSFGFSVGDFIAAIELANKIRKQFVDAPSQFKDISDEYVIEVCL
jgi:hypothetical protein